MGLTCLRSSKYASTYICLVTRLLFLQNLDWFDFSAKSGWPNLGPAAFTYAKIPGELSQVCRTISSTLLVFAWWHSAFIEVKKPPLARRADHPSPEEARLSGAATEDAGHPMETENGVPLIIEYVETKDSQKPYLITQVTKSKI